MDTQTRQTLIEKMYEVIHEEGLPSPNRILIRHPTQPRNCRRAGTTSKSRHYNTYFSISITIASPKYIPDENGKYYLKKDPTQRVKFVGWHEVSRERILEIAAHEMAHLKFWNHKAEHISYTSHLLEILKSKLNDWNIKTSEVV